MEENLNYANLVGWSDMYPFEVIERKSETTLVIRRLQATLDPEWRPRFQVGGFSAHCVNNNEQRWVYSRDNCSPLRIRLHKNGQWKDREGNRYKLSAAPRRFHDYNF